MTRVQPRTLVKRYSVIERITEYYYSNYFLNINGRVCLEGALVFGLGGCAVVYLVAPKLSKIFAKVSNKILVPICGLLISIFVVDLIHSQNHPNTGEGITASRTSHIIVSSILYDRE